MTIVLLVLALAVFNTVGYRLWKNTVENQAWYLSDGGVAFFPIFTSYVIM